MLASTSILREAFSRSTRFGVGAILTEASVDSGTWPRGVSIGSLRIAVMLSRVFGVLHTCTS